MLVEILEGIGTPNPRVTPLEWVIAVALPLLIGTALTAWILGHLWLGIQMIVGFPLWIFLMGISLTLISFLFLDRWRVFIRILSWTAAIAIITLCFTVLMVFAGD